MLSLPLIENGSFFFPSSSLFHPYMSYCSPLSMSNIDYLDVGGESDYDPRRSSSFSSSGSSAEYVPPVSRNTPVTAPRLGGSGKSKSKNNASSFITKLYR